MSHQEKDYFSGSSAQTFSPYSTNQNTQSSFQPNQNSNYLFSQYSNSNNYPSYPTDTSKQNFMNPKPNFGQSLPQTNNMQNFEMMKNLINMFNPQMMQVNQNVNPMDMLVNAGKMLMTNNTQFSQTPQNHKPSQPNMDFSKKNDKSRIEEVFSSNMSNLNQFYQFLNNQQSELNTQNSQDFTPSKFGRDENEVQLPSKSDFQTFNYDHEEQYDPSYRNNSKKQPAMNFRQPSEESSHSAEPGFLTESNKLNKQANGRSQSPIPSQKGGYAVSVAESENRKTSPAMNFDDMPIKSNKNNGVLLNFDENQGQSSRSNKQYENSNQDPSAHQIRKPIKNFDDPSSKPAKQVMNFDDMPIGGSKSPQNSFEPAFKTQKTPQNSESNKPAKQPMSFDDMPIKGADTTKNGFLAENPKSSKPKKNEDREDSSSTSDFGGRDRPAYNNPFDEKPVGGGSGSGGVKMDNFVNSNPAPKSQGTKKPVEKKPFLKKGSRTHLASAADRPLVPKTDSKENLHDDFEVTTTITPKTKAVSRPSTSTSNNTAASNPFSNQNKSTVVSKAEPASPKDNKSKEAKRFLSRGQGRGGGKGTSVDDKQAKQEPVEKKTTSALRKTASPTFEDLLFDKKPKKKTEWDDEDDEENEEKQFDDEDQEYQEEEEEEDNHKRYWDDEDPEDRFDLGGDHKNNSNNRGYDLDKYAKSSAKKSEYTSEKSEFNFNDEEAFDNKKGRNDYDDSEAPTSSLVDKYFYGNKNKQKKKEVEKAKKAEANEKDEKIKALVNEKIEELNNEIAKFKLENERVRKLKLKQEEMLRNYNRDMNDWAKQKDTQLEEFENWKTEEIKKINKDKRVADRNTKALQNMPNRKEREEMESLKKQLSKLTEDIQIKDKRNKLTADRMKKQLDELQQRHSELNEELRVYDKYRTDLSRSNAINQRESHKYTEEPDEEEEEVQAEDEEYEQRDEEEEENEAHHHQQDDDNEVIKEEDEEEEEDEDQEDLQYEDIIRKSNSKNQAQYGSNRSIEERKSNNQYGQVNQNANINYDKFNLASLGEHSSNPGNKEYETPRGFGGKANGNVINNNPPSKAESQLFRKQFNIDDYNFDSNQYYRLHHSRTAQAAKITSQVVTADNKIQKTYSDGKKEVIFHNGVKRESYPDGYTIVHFTNQDIKQTLPDNTIIYFFADAQTCQTTLPNGQNIYKFANNQIEFHYIDGSKEIHFSDGTKKHITANDEEETVFSDGTIQKINAQKIKTVISPNGQKEVIYPDGSRVRTLPDGKIVRMNA